jgi:hypothetical protein
MNTDLSSPVRRLHVRIVRAAGWERQFLTRSTVLLRLDTMVLFLGVLAAWPVSALELGLGWTLGVVTILALGLAMPRTPRLMLSYSQTVPDWKTPPYS